VRIGTPASPNYVHLPSKDGTAIAYERNGDGPAMILVDGAMGFRAFGSAPALSDEAIWELMYFGHAPSTDT
jgi:hypothetical protein